MVEEVNEEVKSGEPEEVVYCPVCGAAMDLDDTACPHCGAEYGFYCPECDAEIPPEAVVCPHCGAELEAGFEDDEGAEEPTVGADGRFTVCANCGEPIDAADEECPACGVDLCPDCGYPLGPEDTICPHCGAEFSFSCPNCGEDLAADADVCPHCGYEFDEDEDADQDVEE